MKYDLEICLPVCFEGKYKLRFDDYKKYGLYKIDPKYKILLSILYGTETLLPEYQEGWPENIEIRWLPAPVNQVAAKVYHYYSTLDTIDDVRWFMRLDDDSCTNIEYIMNFLNEHLDYEQCVYLSTEMHAGETYVEENLLQELNLSHYLYTLFHEVEASIMSQATVKKILNHPDARKYIDERAKIEAGFTDMCMAYAARMAKILPNTSHIISRDPKILDLFSGKTGHIHYLAHDIHPIQYNILKNYIDSPPYFNDKFFLYYKMGENNFPEFVYPLRLVEKGRIVIAPEQQRHFLFWYVDSEQKKLFFLNEHYIPTVQFDVPDMDFTKIKGAWLTIDRNSKTAIHAEVFLQEFRP